MSVKDRFFALAATIEPIPYPLPDGTTVYIEAISALEDVEIQIDIARSLEGKPMSANDKYVAARYAVKAITTDGKGTLMFTKEDIPLIMKMPSRIVMPLLQLVRKVNGQDVTTEKEAKKNSADNSDFSSGSPATPDTSTSEPCSPTPSSAPPT